MISMEKLKEIEQLQKRYNLTEIEVLCITILRIIEETGFTYESYKQLLEDRNKE